MNTEDFNTQTADLTKTPGDGKTRIRLSRFNTKSGKQIRLTNDERKALLTQFDNRKKRKSSWITIAAGVCGAAFGAIFSLFIDMMSAESTGGILAVCLAIPGICVMIYGIYGVVTCPNMEKCSLNAYEFTVDAIYSLKRVRYSRYKVSYQVESLVSISDRESAQYMPRSEYVTSPRLVLSFGGNNVLLLNAEGFNAVRMGIRVGDKVSCAVLECGKYCYISIF